MSQPKQAVVLIHGVGEQVPMDTLRDFVRAVWRTDTAVHNPYVPGQVWSKPDEVSQNYELRRLTTTEGKNGKRTDFFEFYWADLMEATEVKHVAAWAALLLFRSPARVPRQLRGLWWTIAVLAVVVPLWTLLCSFGVIRIPPVWATILGVIGAVVWLAASKFLIEVAGDAARYLHVAPPNIARRRKIRDAGIELLERLHSSGKYDRIVLVGHSLGSVIGYDILRYLWPRYNTAHAANIRNGSTPAQDRLEALAASPGLSVDEYQAGQVAYAAELDQAGNKWLVSDFVTLGCPLAHASFLLARKAAEFEIKKLGRELPSCPPFLETVKGGRRFSYPLDKAWVPHHAAVFGPTRWTNLYFPCRFTLWGDVIGGPVQPAFGPGVRDVPVETDIRGGIFSHTVYWTFPDDTESDEAPDHIAAVRRALQLG